MHERQIRMEEWRPGRYVEVAQIRCTSQVLEQILAVEFVQDWEDGLGMAKEAAFRTVAGRQFGVVEYLDAPKGPLMFILALDDPSTVRADLDAALGVLGLPHSAVVWAHPAATG